MLKGGIFLDIENLVMNGGKGMQWKVIKRLVEAQGVTVLRSNAYMAFDKEKENNDRDYMARRLVYRNRLNREGFHVVLKEVQRFINPDGTTRTKANADLDLAVDALLQADNLDYVLLGTGDGDFLRLVRALQSRGKRVDLFSFANTNRVIAQEVDYHYSGFLLPGILQTPREEEGIHYGFLHFVNEDEGYGFITLRTGL